MAKWALHSHARWQEGGTDTVSLTRNQTDPAIPRGIITAFLSCSLFADIIIGFFTACLSFLTWSRLQAIN